jgi:AraC family transcriptional regulator, transcriptional activator of pobA
LTKTSKNIPIYSLDNFATINCPHKEFQLEVFDANRHFSVEYPHRHDFYEVLFITGGSGIYSIDSHEYSIKPPCIFFMTPGQAHNLELSKDIDGFIFLFTPDFYLINQSNKNKLLSFPFFHSVNRQYAPLYLTNEDDFLFIRNLFEKGCKSVKNNHQPIDLIRSLLDLILNYSTLLYPEESNVIPNTKGHILVKKFMLLIEENYNKNLKVNDYANMLSVSANHLTFLVKQITGKTTNEIIQEKNILEIKRLLLYTNQTITEIAMHMNFADQSYFAKYFKNCTGNTPQQFRTESTKQNN